MNSSVAEEQFYLTYSGYRGAAAGKLECWLSPASTVQQSADLTIFWVLLRSQWEGHTLTTACPRGFICSGSEAKPKCLIKDDKKAIRRWFRFLELSRSSCFHFPGNVIKILHTAVQINTFPFLLSSLSIWLYLPSRGHRELQTEAGSRETMSISELNKAVIKCGFCAYAWKTRTTKRHQVQQLENTKGRLKLKARLRRNG